MSKQEFAQKISSQTSQSSFVGFFRGRKFQGIVSTEQFVLKRIQAFGSESFVIKGEIRANNRDLIINLEFVRGWAQTILPTFFFVISIFLPVLQLLNAGHVDWGYLPFLMTSAIFIFGSQTIKRVEIEKLQQLLVDIAKRNPD